MLSGFFNKLWKDTEGSVLVYTAMFGLIAIGGGALAIDIGQIILLKSEMQHRADAGALAGARQLDGRTGSQDRSRAVAISAMTDSSGVIGGSALPVATVQFYSSLSPLTAAVDDLDANFITVTLDTQEVNFLMAPVLAAVTGTTRDTTDVDAFATAGSNPTVCGAPPLMICDFRETDPLDALDETFNYGRQVRLKEPQGGSTQWAPGNFGLLATPDGSVGANDIEAQLAAVDPGGCYSVDVETATGSKTQKVKDGINARFDMPGNSWPWPAPNVIAYPRDEVLIADTSSNLGDGIWDLAGYWDDKHGGLAPFDLRGSGVIGTPDGTEASRYQVYLYELGLSFLRLGKQTLYPDPDPALINPAPYTRINGALDIPVAVSPDDPTDPYFDGEPAGAVDAAEYEQRRVMTIAQLQCVRDDVKGHGSYPTDGNFIEVFITEPVQDPPEAAIYGEVVRALTANNSSEYYANVGLLY